MDIKEFLEEKVHQYNSDDFIELDPISIPHRFSLLQDVEIIGFWVAMLSWGQRKTILNKANELLTLMDNAPYDFIKNHQEHDRKRFLSFKHRTFQPDDTLYFLDYFQRYYSNSSSLEDAFVDIDNPTSTKHALIKFHSQFFDSPNALQRTKKHVSTPLKNSSCKRLNMFLRWMVRKDSNHVDFGLWSKIEPANLMIPLDIHVYRVAHSLGLLNRNKTDWQAVEELTITLRGFDPLDPVKYDFALFSLGINQRSLNLL